MRRFEGRPHFKLARGSSQIWRSRLSGDFSEPQCTRVFSSTEGALKTSDDVTCYIVVHPHKNCQGFLLCRGHFPLGSFRGFG
jgi:hypothetical protein